MCGIFGYIGDRDAPLLVMEGLERLAYRGYDSAGVASIDHVGHVAVRKAPGKLDALQTLLGTEPLAGTAAIGHTRWATHGEPNQANAHPHIDGTGDVVVVHNGIIENYVELKDRLLANGHEFTSHTDTEIIPHLIQELLGQGHGFEESVRLAATELRGAHAIACMHARTPEILVTLRIGNAGGVAIGHGGGEMFLSSDLPALLPVASAVTYLAPGEIAVVHREGCEVQTLEGVPVDTTTHQIAMNPVAAAKGGHRHFMLKEIMEQPEAAMSGLRGRLDFAGTEVALDEVPFSNDDLRAIDRVTFAGMGTTLHACQVGARLMELLARIPASAENAAEFRYRSPVVDGRSLVVAVTQSGETADTLEALHTAAGSRARTMAITNAEDSQAARSAQATMLMHAGPEVAVASSKTFVNSMLAMLLLAAGMGEARGAFESSAHAALISDLSRLPALLGDALDMNEERYQELAHRYAHAKRFLFIGRGLQEPIAREGALKLKEISYIHAEGMSAAEMKHGPIALVDSDTPVVAIAIRDELCEKMLGNISEIKARSGKVIAIATAGDEQIAQIADDVLWVPESPSLLAPFVTTIPLQLLAYHMAVHLGNDVDQPRNLAKSVTVE